jgi:hypothetical protein
MLVSVGPTTQFEEWMQQYPVGLSEGDHKRFGLTECVSNIPVSVRRYQSSLRVVEVCSADPEQPYPEDRLGCARGVLWALVFEAGLVIAALVYWKLRFTR